MKKFDKTNFFFSWKPKNERIRFYAICVHLLHYKILAAPKKFKKRPRRLNRPKANHKCHKKPNPSREPVLLNAHCLMAQNICKIWNVSLFTLQIRPASPIDTTQEYLPFFLLYNFFISLQYLRLPLSTSPQSSPFPSPSPSSSPSLSRFVLQPTITIQIGEANRTIRRVFPIVKEIAFLILQYWPKTVILFLQKTSCSNEK